MAESNALLDVTIDFEQSHLFFPQIVHWILLFLAGLILFNKASVWLNNRKQGTRELSSLPRVNSDTEKNQTQSTTDWLRLGGTLALTIAYFTLMDSVGTFFPNMGLGFLLTSIPFMFLLSILYVHNAGRRQILTIALSSLITPTVAWYLLAQVFNISLP